jgi:transposase
VVFNGSCNKKLFETWVEKFLINELKSNQVVIMDNAAFHKGKDMQNMITESGHILLYLPTYSPDLNPIEKKWAQAKKLRRSLQCNIDQLFKSYLL